MTDEEREQDLNMAELEAENRRLKKRPSFLNR